ncbi:MAG: holo-ACP synthase [Deltaproteobacteria bacterium]|nr:holo-ACP synthase [Deltaproteobacteria bacterium]
MLLGLGLDLARVDRIRAAWERHGTRFLDRVFTPEEVRYCLARPRPAHALALRFAAKEAFAKATGLGLRGLSWREIGVVSDARGKPSLALTGRAQTWARDHGVTGVHLSLTDDGDYAAAVVVLEGEPGQGA